MNIILYIIISAVTLCVTVAVFISTGRIKNNKAAIKVYAHLWCAPFWKLYYSI